MLPLDYSLLSSSQVTQAAREGYIPVVPFGSLEQHCKGPLGTDSIIVEAVAREACRRARLRDAPCLVLPTVYYGFSPEWLNAGGTVSLGLEAFVLMTRSILDSLYYTGFSRILLLNGHGGNSGLLYSATVEWVSRHRGSIVAIADYWRLAGVDIGHASRVEERLLSDAGVEAYMGDCESIAIGGPGRIVNPPTSTASAKPSLEDEDEATLSYVADKVAGFLVRLKHADPGAYSL